MCTSRAVMMEAVPWRRYSNSRCSIWPGFTGRVGGRRFGDDWEHDILIEDVTAPEAGTAYLRCLTGRRACPPEDCGGIWGYDYLVEILADSRHEEHKDRLEWLGLDSADQFDPAAFDAAQVNSALSPLATVLIKN
ncbi:plasmid pRiA4b ORF-3 family protein [Streptomyces sp. NPDC046900]|uniref:plasmid pRiA4b ORF-3 family protein n=1 Tax=Streptomyces sp. NPDC046900 TaxID=3155473 RepID=UPI0033C2502F